MNNPTGVFLEVTYDVNGNTYLKTVAKPISTLSCKEMFARVPMKGMPNPTGKVYKG